MRRVVSIWTLALLLVAAPVAPARAASGADPAGEEAVHAIAARLRCVVCQNLSVADSPSDMARQMRDLIRERLAAGDTPAQVETYFVQRYGEWVLLAPRPHGLNLLLWLAPFAAVAGGLALVLSLVHRWRRRPDSPGSVTTLTVEPRDRERIAAELERLGD